MSYGLLVILITHINKYKALTQALMALSMHLQAGLKKAATQPVNTCNCMLQHVLQIKSLTACLFIYIGTNCSLRAIRTATHQLLLHTACHLTALLSESIN